MFGSCWTDVGSAGAGAAQFAGVSSAGVPSSNPVPRRATIVCTLGPATHSGEQVRALVDAGMDVARLNFSHGTRDDHQALYRAVREASDASGRAVAVLVDLQGPKIRLGTFAAGPVT